MQKVKEAAAKEKDAQAERERKEKEREAERDREREKDRDRAAREDKEYNWASHYRDLKYFNLSPSTLIKKSLLVHGEVLK